MEDRGQVLKCRATEMPEDVAAALIRERECTAAAMSAWMADHRKLYQAHLEQQQQLLQTLLSVHDETLQVLGIRSIGGDTGGARSELPVTVHDSPSMAGPSALRPSMPHFSRDPISQPQPCDSDAVDFEDHQDPNAVASGPLELPREGRSFSDQLEALSEGTEALEWWRRCSGMHTVENWCKNYKKHPAGWGALLMIHGIPEISGRLRSKVENYAIYSALFLSMSIALLVSPPEAVTQECPHFDISDVDCWLCEARKRAYLYCCAAGTASHMLSILLGMLFVNALNEAARDSDVFRMFARGQGFVATVKCQNAFRFGCIADFVSVIVAVSYYIGWEAVVVAAILIAAVMRMLRQTSGRLFANVSIVKYWRTELGGTPDNDDPYDLDVALDLFTECLKANQGFFVNNDGSQREERCSHKQRGCASASATPGQGRRQSGASRPSRAKSASQVVCTM